jgi:DNA polymerase III epsilon subunit-like protein
MIAVDVEASGVNYEKNSIVSIGAIDLENPVDQFYGECRVWDGAHINEEALEVNGFTEEEITDPAKQSEGDLARAFMAWSENVALRTLGGQNVSFDRDFIKAACEREGLNWDLPHRSIDVHTLAWMHMVKAGVTPPTDDQRRSKLNLDAVLVYCGIPEEPQPHNALTGAMCHAEVISRLLYDKKLLPEFDQYDIPWQTAEKS